MEYGPRHRRTGLAAILAGVVLIVAILRMGLAGDGFFSFSTQHVLPFVLLLLGGLAELQTRQTGRSGCVGLVGFGLAAIGGALIVAIPIARWLALDVVAPQKVFPTTGAPHLFMTILHLGGVGALLVGLILFGITTIRTRVLPRQTASMLALGLPLTLSAAMLIAALSEVEVSARGGMYASLEVFANGLSFWFLWGGVSVGLGVFAAGMISSGYILWTGRGISDQPAQRPAGTPAPVKSTANQLIKINTASPEEIQALPGIGPKRAQNIVEYREKLAYFRGPEGLAQVPGISVGLANRLSEFIDWQEVPAEEQGSLETDRRSSTRLYRYLQQGWIGGYLKGLGSFGWSVMGVLSVIITIAGVQGVRGLVEPVLPADDAIRIDYEVTHSTGAPAGLIEDFDPNKGLSYYDRKHRIAYSYPVINIDVVSEVDDEWIKLAPYLVVAMTDVKPVPDNVDYVSPAGGGGGGRFDIFSATLSPYRDEIFGAPQVRATMSADELQIYSPNQKPFDYFTLQPGEREVFKLQFLMLPGYYYHYRIGVLYSYKDNESVKWIDREFLAAQPTEAKREWLIVYQGPGGGYKVQERPNEQSMEAGANTEETRQTMAENVMQEEQAIQKYQSSFQVPQHEPDE